MHLYSIYIQCLSCLNVYVMFKGDFNVITVDWHSGAVLPYEQATANTRVVGAQVAQLVNKLIHSYSSNSALFHIIGHSLGAHVAGYAGERISHLARISGNNYYLTVMSVLFKGMIYLLYSVIKVHIQCTPSVNIYPGVKRCSSR